MQLILATDYAIRSILYLTLVERMATASEVSEKMKIPKQYLVTTSRKLKAADLIAAVPGVSGGYFLARPPEEITLLDIIKATEGTILFDRCLEHNEDCCSVLKQSECPVREVYVGLQSIMEETLSKVTIAKLRTQMEKNISHD